MPDSSLRSIAIPISNEVTLLVTDRKSCFMSAVRWQLSATHDGKPFHRAMMAIYRFEQGRIAEDWGILAQGEWPDSAPVTVPPEGP